MAPDRSVTTLRRIFQLGLLATVAVALLACGDPGGTNDTGGQTDTGVQNDTGPDAGGRLGPLARGPFPTPGVIKRIDVSGPGGDSQRKFGVRHPVDIAVDVDPNDGWSDRIVGYPNLHVGLVERVENEEDREDAGTCYLGSLTGRETGGTILDNGRIRFERRYFVPKTCLGDAPSGTFNVWVALNPARRLPDESFTIPEKDFNTQFFNPLYDDTEDSGRNDQCTGANGAEGCIYDLEIDFIEGFNVAAGETKLSSDVFIFDDAVCDSNDDFGNPLANVRTSLQMSGTSMAFEKALESNSHADALESAGVETVSIIYEICPRAGDGDCVDGESYQSAAVGGPAPESGPSTLVNSVEVDSLTVGDGRDTQAALYIKPGPLCESLAGWSNNADWSSYRIFNLRSCVSGGFSETSPGSDASADDCSISILRMVPIDETPGGGGQQSRIVFDNVWREDIGGSVLGAYAEFGSQNRINFDGARNRTYAESGISGWLDIALIEAALDVRSSTASAGSGVDAYLEVLQSRLWSARDNSDTQTIQDSLSFSKRECIRHNYGIAGVGLNASFCSTGTAGVEVDIEVSKQTGAGPAPFDSASSHGGVENIITPFGNFELEASANLDIVAARGGMDGFVDLIDARLPVESDLDWGEVSGPAVIAAWDLGIDLELLLLAGHVDVFVDLARPGWCDCGRFCGYPCRKWARVVNERLVSFSGSPARFPILGNTNTRGVTLTR